MRLFLAAILFAPLLSLAQSPEAKAFQDAVQKLNWQRGETSGRIGTNASIKVPKAYAVLDEASSSKYLEMVGNPPRNGNYLFAPESLGWFAVFSFNPSGYVKDDEKIDPAAILKSIQEGDGPANEERKRMGLSTLSTEGWIVEPHYDAGTKRLEWGAKLRSGTGEQIVNYTMRILGREGVMSVTLVSDPESLSKDLGQFRPRLAGFAYDTGKSYTEFRDGDKIAEYGLSALIVGGAAAAAAKTGILKGLGKFIWVFVIGAFAGISALWKKLTGKKE